MKKETALHQKVKLHNCVGEYIRYEDGLRFQCGQPGLTGYQMAKETGVALPTIYRYINNPDIIPAGDVLKKLCETYECSPNAFVEITYADKLIEHIDFTFNDEPERRIPRMKRGLHRLFREIGVEPLSRIYLMDDHKGYLTIHWSGKPSEKELKILNEWWSYSEFEVYEIYHSTHE